MKRSSIVLCAVLFCTAPLAAQQETAFAWFPGGTYDPAIPTPAEFLGYEIGTNYTFHHEMQAYLEAVAAASDRVTMATYGQTYEGRDLLLLTITSPANHARLEEIRTNMATLADPRGAPRARLDEIIASSPATAWLSYNVHGSESAGTEAALLTVYQLAAGTDSATRIILDELVVLLDPLLNPDGRDRFVHDYRIRRGAEPDDAPEAWERSGDLPGGRSNHYYFDLNRDWAWQTQVETRQRLETYLLWNPVVHVDFHEMGGDSYFFFPAAKPVHDAMPEVVLKWQRIYGEGNAAAFDAYGWPYYTKIGFDMYYPAYGDSWPSMMGAIGMTYEQGGGGGVAIVLRRDDGTVHSLTQRAHGHFTTSMATLTTTAERRSERLTDFLAFFRHALSRDEGDVKGYALVPGADPWNADRLVQLLLRNGIEVTMARAPFRARTGSGYGLHPAGANHDFPAGTYLVAAGQPRGVAVQMLLEPNPTLEDTSFYDLSGWTLPLAYNVEAYTLTEAPGVDAVGVDSPPERTGAIEGTTAGYGWAIPYEGTHALGAVMELLNRDLRVLCASEGFTSGGRSYAPGTFILPNYRNPDDLVQIIAGVTEEWEVTAWPIETGLVEEGDDLGAGSYNQLRRPRIAVAAGGGGFGEAWHFFDRHYPWFDVTHIEADRLGRTDLDAYDVLVLPGGSYAGSLGESGVAALRSWLQGGGVLIAWDAAARFASQEGSQLTSVSTGGTGGGSDRGQRMSGGGAPPAAGQRGSGGGGGGGDELAVDARRTLAEREQEGRLRRTPGGMYGVVLDPDHWLAFGMPEKMAVLKRSRTSFAVAERGVNVAVFSPEPLLCGYAPTEYTEELSKRSWLIVENVGRGQAVLFADDPLFRMFVEGQHQFVLNALILGPGF